MVSIIALGELYVLSAEHLNDTDEPWIPRVKISFLRFFTPKTTMDQDRDGDRTRAMDHNKPRAGQSHSLRPEW